MDVVDLLVEIVGLDVLELIAGLHKLANPSPLTSNPRDAKRIHTFESYWLTLPSSWPAMINLPR